jgi:hypothetical protein
MARTSSWRSLLKQLKTALAAAFAVSQPITEKISSIE